MRQAYSATESEHRERLPGDDIVPFPEAEGPSMAITGAFCGLPAMAGGYQAAKMLPIRNI